MNGMDGWTCRAEERPDGATLTATAGRAGDAAKTRALGFIGVMARGSGRLREGSTGARSQAAGRPLRSSSSPSSQASSSSSWSPASTTFQKV